MPKVVPANKSKNISYTLKLNQEIKRKVQEASKKEGVSEGEYIRRLILKA